MVKFLLWCILLFFCWPLALLALVLYPLVWILTLPFRLVGIAVEGVFELLRATDNSSRASSQRTAPRLRSARPPYFCFFGWRSWRQSFQLQFRRLKRQDYLSSSPLGAGCC